VASVALPESSDTLRAEPARDGRALLALFVGTELAWVTALGYLLIRFLLFG
jgi:hypothetical protein